MPDEEKRKFESLLKYYRERVLGAVCNRTRLALCVDDLVSFLLQAAQEREDKAKNGVEEC